MLLLLFILLLLLNSFIIITCLFLLKWYLLYQPKGYHLEASLQRHQCSDQPQRPSCSQTPLSSNPKICAFMCMFEGKRVMGLLLLCGIRCALFVCFVSVGEAGPSQNMGSVSGSVNISSSYNKHSNWLSDMAYFLLNYFCVHCVCCVCVDVIAFFFLLVSVSSLNFALGKYLLLYLCICVLWICILCVRKSVTVCCHWVMLSLFLCVYACICKSMCSTNHVNLYCMILQLLFISAHVIYCRCLTRKKRKGPCFKICNVCLTQS